MFLLQKQKQKEKMIQIWHHIYDVTPKGHRWSYVYLDGEAEYNENGDLYCHSKADAPDIFVADCRYPSVGIHKVFVKGKGPGLAFLHSSRNKVVERRTGGSSCCLVILDSEPDNQARQRKVYGEQRKRFFEHQRYEQSKEKNEREWRKWYLAKKQKERVERSNG